MGRLLHEDKEFEKNKKEILRRIKSSNFNLALSDSRNDIVNKNCSNVGKQKYAWEYEIEEYRKKKNLEKFYKIGAISGIISLIVTIFDKFIPAKEITSAAIAYILKL
ncbi:hypothetical protein [Maledivibacter halophilus]|uniref:Uncharacterized protein n=1 Tax=Maledivibacter halophilus TaxID=36842 RepID=A0A1T5IR14_9FIRM|nr:hypothetical protein [Maledivibacter halophilus]SKC41383.1 hypothetical protein SAMN02194393_00637 [Maledivibacter halophilus]